MYREAARPRERLPGELLFTPGDPGRRTVWWWRPRATGILLHIERGELTVDPRARTGRCSRVRLDDLTDVVLETRTIQPLLDGGSAIPALRFSESRVGGEVDKSRIALERGDDERILLGDTYLAHLDALEWFGKIRVFLRKHGWVPEDERDLRPD